MTTNGTFRQAVLTGPKQIVFQDVPLGTPGPDEVLVKVYACAICTWEKRA